MAEAYQVIARRWRPKQFDELVGQEHIVRTLKNAIEANRIAHAYLFVGPRGTGKTTTARLFAKALNAEGGPSATPDNETEISKAIMSGSCMDVIEIDGASNNGVDQIRDLRQECQYAPAQGTYKIYIIDEVHMLSNQAWNALLKTLEEPPPHVKFIFATTEAHKVLPTVVSRCQRFEFRPIADEKISAKLGEIAEAESINITPGALTTIARMADGGMRDAQSILDQLISFCGNKITDENVLDVYGLASEDDLKALTEAMAAAAHKDLFALIERLAGEGRDLYRLLLDIQRVVRQALLEAIVNEGHTNMLGTPLTAESLTRMLDALQAAEYTVRQGLSQRVNFEVALLRAIDQSRSRAIDTLIKELSQLAAGLPEDAGQKKISPSLTAEATAPASTKAAVKPRAKAASAPTPEASSTKARAVETSKSRPEHASRDVAAARAETASGEPTPKVDSTSSRVGSSDAKDTAGTQPPVLSSGPDAASEKPPIVLPSDPPRKERFVVKPEPEPASHAKAEASEKSPPIVLPDDDVPLEVLEAAGAAVGEGGEYLYTDEYTLPAQQDESMSFPGSKAYETARTKISEATLTLLDERLRAVPKYVKKVPQPRNQPQVVTADDALVDDLADLTEDENED